MCIYIYIHKYYMNYPGIWTLFDVFAPKHPAAAACGNRNSCPRRACGHPGTQTSDPAAAGRQSHTQPGICQLFLITQRVKIQRHYLTRAGKKNIYSMFLGPKSIMALYLDSLGQKYVISKTMSQGQHGCWQAQIRLLERLFKMNP